MLLSFCYPSFFSYPFLNYPSIANYRSLVYPLFLTPLSYPFSYTLKIYFWFFHSYSFLSPSAFFLTFFCYPCLFMLLFPTSFFLAALFVIIAPVFDTSFPYSSLSSLYFFSSLSPTHLSLLLISYPYLSSLS